MAYVDEDMWTEALAEVERNDPNWVEVCECGNQECDCDGSEEMTDGRLEERAGVMMDIEKLKELRSTVVDIWASSSESPDLRIERLADVVQDVIELMIEEKTTNHDQ